MQAGRTNKNPNNNGKLNARDTTVDTTDPNKLHIGFSSIG